MKKGDIRKAEILKTAENLFCKKGYEHTAVQDIIDQLHSSKGSFYHHYPSKESVLEGICDHRAEKIFVDISARIDSMKSVAPKINCLLSGMIPISNEKISFILMLLPVFILPEGKMIRMYYCDAITARFQNLFKSLLEAGHKSNDLFCMDPEDASDLILSNINRLWTDICKRIIINERSHTEHDLSEYLRIIEFYRSCIERILCLPYGSLVLIDLSDLNVLIREIHNHWKCQC